MTKTSAIAPKTLLVFDATHEMGGAISQALACQGDRLLLAGTSAEALTQLDASLVQAELHRTYSVDASGGEAGLEDLARWATSQTTLVDGLIWILDDLSPGAGAKREGFEQLAQQLWPNDGQPAHQGQRLEAAGFAWLIASAPAASDHCFEFDDLEGWLQHITTRAAAPRLRVNLIEGRQSQAEAVARVVVGCRAFADTSLSGSILKLR